MGFWPTIIGTTTKRERERAGRRNGVKGNNDLSPQLVQTVETNNRNVVAPF